MKGHKPFMGSDEFITAFSFWTGLRAKLFGKRYEQYAGPYHLIAYLYRGTWYITKYGAR